MKQFYTNHVSNLNVIGGCLPNALFTNANKYIKPSVNVEAEFLSRYKLYSWPGMNTKKNTDYMIII